MNKPIIIEYSGEIDPDKMTTLFYEKVDKLQETYGPISCGVSSSPPHVQLHNTHRIPVAALTPVHEALAESVNQAKI